MQESAYFIKPNVVKKGMIYKRDFINSFKYVFLCDYYFLDNVYNLMDQDWNRNYRINQNRINQNKRNRVESNTIEWNATEWNILGQNRRKIEFNRIKQNGMERNRSEWNRIDWKKYNRIGYHRVGQDRTEWNKTQQKEMKQERTERHGMDYIKITCTGIVQTIKILLLFCFQTLQDIQINIENKNLKTMQSGNQVLFQFYIMWF